MGGHPSGGASIECINAGSRWTTSPDTCLRDIIPPPPPPKATDACTAAATAAFEPCCPGGGGGPTACLYTTQTYAGMCGVAECRTALATADAACAGDDMADNPTAQAYSILSTAVNCQGLDPALSCNRNNEFGVIFAPINVECCDEPTEDCSSGFPASCNAQCGLRCVAASSASGV